MTREHHRIVVLDDHMGVARESADWSPVTGREDVAEVVFRREHLPEQELVRLAQGSDVVVAMRERSALSRRVLEQLSQLRLLVTTGMVNAAIDLAAARELGITVCGTGGRGPDPAELAWALTMDLVRGVTAADRDLRAGRWQPGRPGRRLAGLVVGVAGLGVVGAQVAGYAQAFGCHVLGWSQHLTPERAAEVGATAVGKDELFERSDVVTLHLKLSERTRAVVAAPELGLLGADGFLVNTARAGLVVEDDLLAALGSGSIAGAALDVFGQEPLPPGHALLAEPRALLTPHLGYVSRESFSAFYGQVVEDVVAWLDGRPVRVLAAPGA